MCTYFLKSGSLLTAGIIAFVTSSSTVRRPSRWGWDEVASAQSSRFICMLARELFLCSQSKQADGIHNLNVKHAAETAEDFVSHEEMWNSASFPFFQTQKCLVSILFSISLGRGELGYCKHVLDKQGYSVQRG